MNTTAKQNLPRNIKPVAGLRGERLRKKLLETGGRLIAEQTLAQISVEDILAEVGVSRRTFYRHFANKYELAAAVINPALTEGAQLLGKVSKEDSDQAIPGIVDCYIQLWTAHQIALNIISSIEPEVMPYLEESHREFGTLLKAILASAEKASHLRNNSAEITFRVISRTAVPLLKIYADHPEFERLYKESMITLLSKD